MTIKEQEPSIVGRNHVQWEDRCTQEGQICESNIEILKEDNGDVVDNLNFNLSFVLVQDEPMYVIRVTKLWMAENEPPKRLRFTLRVWNRDGFLVSGIFASSTIFTGNQHSWIMELDNDEDICKFSNEDFMYRAPVIVDLHLSIEPPPPP